VGGPRLSRPRDYRPHLWRTTDFGKTWTELVAGLPGDRGSLTVFESPRNARVLWVGTSDGVFAPWMAACAGGGSARASRT